MPIAKKSHMINLNPNATNTTNPNWPVEKKHKAAPEPAQRPQHKAPSLRAQQCAPPQCAPKQRAPPNPRSSIKYFQELSDERIRKCVEEAVTFHEVLQNLGFQAQKQSWNHNLERYKSNLKETLISRCDAMNCPHGHLRNRCYDEANKRKREEEASPTANKNIHTNQLRQILKDDNREYVCAWCRCANYVWDKHANTWLWQGRPFSLEVHHIAGRKIDNPHAAENLMLLCPQCHATTENYGNRKQIVRAEGGERAPKAQRTHVS